MMAAMVTIADKTHFTHSNS